MQDTNETSNSAKDWQSMRIMRGWDIRFKILNIRRLHYAMCEDKTSVATRVSRFAPNFAAQFAQGERLQQQPRCKYLRNDRDISKSIDSVAKVELFRNTWRVRDKDQPDGE